MGTVNWALIGTIAAVLVALAVIAGAIAAIRQSNAPPVPPTSVTLAQRIDGIPCNDENIYYHEHAFLAIVVRGKNVPVPANIGIDDDTCVYWLHTHDNSGEIHMEAPSFRPFTLGQLFDIWHQPLSRTDVAGHMVARGTHILIYLNGHKFTGDPRLIPLRKHVEITIEIGPPFVPSQRFNFDGD